MATRFFDVSGQPAPPADAPPAAEPVQRGQTADARLALLIGNARYPGATLRNPVSDVRMLGFVLRQMGFDTEIVENADRARMVRALDGFAARLEAAGGRAIALFHFAGHGLQQGQSLYLLPANTPIASTSGLELAALSLELAIARLSSVETKGLVAVVDACRVRDADEGAATVHQSLNAMTLPKRETLVVYSTSAGETAEDGDGRHSPYAWHLAHRLPGMLDPGRRAHEVFITAGDDVAGATGGRQRPALYLQGSLPPLELDDTDAERLKAGIRILPPRTSWLRLGAAGAGALAVAAAVAAGWFWLGLYPEERRALMARAGLAAPLEVDMACAAPWDRADVFGVTRAEWCSLTPDKLPELPVLDDTWESHVEPLALQGHPKALLLVAARHMAALDEAAEIPATVRTRIVRAAKQGMPMAHLALAFLDGPGGEDGFSYFDETSGGLGNSFDSAVAAARAGYMPAVQIIAVEELRNGRGTEAIARLERVAAGDLFGGSDLMLAEIYLGRFPQSGIAFDMVRAEDHLRRASAAGNILATDNLISLFLDGDARTVQADELQTFIDRLRDSDDPQGDIWADFWTGSILLFADDSDSVTEGLKMLVSAAEAGEQRAALKLGLLYARGNLSEDAGPTVTPDTDVAHNYYRLALNGDLNWATFEAAVALWTGRSGRKDPEAARPALEFLVQRGQPREARDAEEFLLSRDKLAALEADTLPWEVRLGREDAGISVVLYPHIGNEDGDLFNRFVTRPLVVLALSDLITLRIRAGYPRADSFGGRLVRRLTCVPPEHRHRALDAFASGQEDVTGGWAYPWESAARPVPLDEAACLAPDEIDAARRAHGTTLAFASLPLLFLDGAAVERGLLHAGVDIVLTELMPPAYRRAVAELDAKVPRGQ